MEPLTWFGCEIVLIRGDITTLAVDAIVNAANSGLRGGGGVDGAIHSRGGPIIAEQCQRLIQARGRPLAPGEAEVTEGGRLPARLVIHAVGPIYTKMPRAQAEAKLAECYTRSLALLRAHRLTTIAFPCISTGAFGYPSAEACPVALAAVHHDLKQHAGCERVTFCTYANHDYELYSQHLPRFLQTPRSAAPTNEPG